MPKKSPKKKAAARRAVKKDPAKTVEEADPRFEPVAKAFARTVGFSLMESKSRATRGLMLNGKSFGMSTHGRFILKLDEERAKALIADGTAKPFGSSPGKVMKGWIEVTSPKANWVALAREAHRIAAGSGKKASGKNAR